jgi:hypothetical protein
MKKIIKATLFFMISVFFAWFTIGAAETPSPGNSAGAQLAHCSVPFKPHNPYNKMNSILDSTRSILLGNSAEKVKHEGNDDGEN